MKVLAPDRGEVLGPVEAVGVHVVEAEPPLVLGDDGVGRARHLVLDPEAEGQALREGGLARAEPAPQRDDRPAADGGAQPSSQFDGVVGSGEEEFPQGSLPLLSMSTTKSLMAWIIGRVGQPTASRMWTLTSGGRRACARA